MRLAVIIGRYDEWHAKPVEIVSYGREHGVCHATGPSCGRSSPSAGYEAAAMLDQLVWSAETVRDARNKRPYQPERIDP
jgi:hypothetical protein